MPEPKENTPQTFNITLTAEEEKRVVLVSSRIFDLRQELERGAVL